MILLTSTGDALLLITGGSQVVHVKADWIDQASGGVFTPGHLANATGAVVSATTTTIVPSPASSVERNVKFISVTNTDPTTSVSITLQHTDGTTPLQIGPKINLLPGYSWTYNDLLGFVMLDASGGRVESPLTGRLLKRSVLTSGTSFTSSPSTNTLILRGVGGGGGGAGCTSVASAAAAGGGGGAGGYIEKTVAVTPNTAYAYTVGSAGAGASGAAGGSGGASTFVIGGTTYTANGGGGAPVATATTTVNTPYLGGAGAAISTNGDLNAGGQPGDPGVFTAVTPVGFSGNGADSPFGGGGIGLKSTGANGNSAVGFGSGGGGAMTGTAAVRTGGSGTAGMWIVEEYS